jgi:hypothetical protein
LNLKNFAIIIFAISVVLLNFSNINLSIPLGDIEPFIKITNLGLYGLISILLVELNINDGISNKLLRFLLYSLCCFIDLTIFTLIFAGASLSFLGLNKTKNRCLTTSIFYGSALFLATLLRIEGFFGVGNSSLYSIGSSYLAILVWVVSLLLIFQTKGEQHQKYFKLAIIFVILPRLMESALMNPLPQLFFFLIIVPFLAGVFIKVINISEKIQLRDMVFLMLIIMGATTNWIELENFSKILCLFLILFEVRVIALAYFSKYQQLIDLCLAILISISPLTPMYFSILRMNFYQKDIDPIVIVSWLLFTLISFVLIKSQGMNLKRIEFINSLNEKSLQKLIPLMFLCYCFMWGVSYEQSTVAILISRESLIFIPITMIVYFMLNKYYKFIQRGHHKLDGFNILIESGSSELIATQSRFVSSTMGSIENLYVSVIKMQRQFLRDVAYIIASKNISELKKGILFVFFILALIILYSRTIN